MKGSCTYIREFAWQNKQTNKQTAAHFISPLDVHISRQKWLKGKTLFTNFWFYNTFETQL